MTSPHPPSRPEAQSSPRSDWLIVGHGALASLWAHHLAESGQPVAIITRAKNAPSACILHSSDTDNQDAKNAPGACILHNSDAGHQDAKNAPSACFLHDQGAESPNARPAQSDADHPTVTLSIDTASGHTQTREFAAFYWQNLHTQIHAKTRILIMVKAWQLQTVIEQLNDAIDQAGCVPEAIILSHNGMGAAEAWLNQKLRQGWPIFDLVTTHGAWRKHGRHVVHAGAGSSMVGPRRPSTDNTCMAPPSWFEQLDQALPPLAWEPDILLRRWHKLAINCAINPLATVARQPNGVLLNREYHADVRAICEEIAAVACHVLGADRLTADALEAQVHQVIAATQHNICSMLQDIQNKNPTEIDYLNGYVAKLAGAFDLPAPVNQRMADAIKQLNPDASGL